MTSERVPPGRVGPGTKLDHYTIVALLGKGGMGQVFRARDERLGRDVALKVVSPSSGDRGRRDERFLREIEAASRVTHENVVRVHGAGEANGVRYLVTELVEGESLEQVLARARPFETRRAAERWRGLALALSALHAVGVLHRDVKPSNVPVDAVGAKDDASAPAAALRGAPPRAGERPAPRGAGARSRPQGRPRPRRAVPLARAAMKRADRNPRTVQGALAALTKARDFGLDLLAAGVAFCSDEARFNTFGLPDRVPDLLWLFSEEVGGRLETLASFFARCGADVLAWPLRSAQDLVEAGELPRAAAAVRAARGLVPALADKADELELGVASVLAELEQHLPIAASVQRRLAVTAPPRKP